MPVSTLEKEFNQLTDEQQGVVITIINYFSNANTKPENKKKNKVLYRVLIILEYDVKTTRDWKYILKYGRENKNA